MQDGSSPSPSPDRTPDLSPNEWFAQHHYPWVTTVQRTLPGWFPRYLLQQLAFPTYATVRLDGRVETTLDDLVAWMGCGPRRIARGLALLEERRLIHIEYPEPGVYRVRLRTETVP